MRFQSGIGHRSHLRMTFEEFGHFHGAFLCTVDAYAEGLEAADYHICLMRVHIAAEVEHHYMQFFVEFLCFGDNDAAHYVGVAVDELGNGVQHHIGAQVERILQIGTAESVVHHKQKAFFVSQFCTCFDVGYAHRWVGRRFDVQHFCVGTYGGFDVIDVFGFHVRGFHTETRHVSFYHGARSSVNGVGGNHVVAGVEVGHVNGAYSAHSRGESHGAIAVLQLCHLTLQGGDGGVADTGVNVAVFLSCKAGGAVLGTLETECGCLINRHSGGAVFVVVAASVYQFGVESEILGVFHCYFIIFCYVLYVQGDWVPMPCGRFRAARQRLRRCDVCFRSRGSGIPVCILRVRCRW